jgi:hypothetical protein
MDFENSHDGKHETRYDTIMTLSDVYFDMTKLFTTLHSDTNNIDKRFTTTINALYKKPMQDGAPITKKLLESIFAEIDLIQCDPRVVLAREN